MIIAIRKFFSWIKAYWYIPVIIIAIIAGFVLFQKVPKSLIDILAKRREIHQKEVNAINKIHAEEIEKRERALEIYYKTIKEIEEKYDENIANLTSRKKKKIKKIIDETHDDPDKLAEKLSDQMGFIIVNPKEKSS